MLASGYLMPTQSRGHGTLNARRNRTMPRTRAGFNSLTELLDQSTRPVYAVDDAAANRLLQCGLGGMAGAETGTNRRTARRIPFRAGLANCVNRRRVAAPLADLCPPPSALAGEPSAGTISCVARDGRLQHRRADLRRWDRGSKAQRKNGQSVAACSCCWPTRFVAARAGQRKCRASRPRMSCTGRSAAFAAHRQADMR